MLFSAFLRHMSTQPKAWLSDAWLPRPPASRLRPGTVRCPAAPDAAPGPPDPLSRRCARPPLLSGVSVGFEPLHALSEPSHQPLPFPPEQQPLRAAHGGHLGTRLPPLQGCLPASPLQQPRASLPPILSGLGLGGQSRRAENQRRQAQVMPVAGGMLPPYPSTSRHRETCIQGNAAEHTEEKCDPADIRVL